MSRPEHYAKLRRLFPIARDALPNRFPDDFTAFAIEYLCNELSITDEAVRLLSSRVAVLENKAKRDIPPTTIAQDAAMGEYRERTNALYFAIYLAIPKDSGATIWKLFERALKDERNMGLEQAASKCADADTDFGRSFAILIRALKSPEQP